MANKEHTALANKGADTINAWRRDNPGVQLDLKDADLSGAQLQGADLTGADMRGTILEIGRAHV